MRVLIGNMVKTEYGDYPCATREEAEALFRTLEERDARKAAPGEDDEPPAPPAPDGRRLDS